MHYEVIIENVQKDDLQCGKVDSKLYLSDEIQRRKIQLKLHVTISMSCNYTTCKVFLMFTLTILFPLYVELNVVERFRPGTGIIDIFATYVRHHFPLKQFRHGPLHARSLHFIFQLVQ